MSAYIDMAAFPLITDTFIIIPHDIHLSTSLHNLSILPFMYFSHNHTYMAYI